MKRIFSLALFLICFSISNAFSAGLTSEERLQDFNQLKSIIQSQYGPFAFKQAQGIIRWEELNKEFESRVRGAKNNQEFYSAIIEYVARFKDGHFSVRNPSNLVAKVPVTVDLIEGKVLISFIDKEKLPADKFDFAIGDEIIAVNGVAIQQVVDGLEKFTPSGNPVTVRRKAAWAVTRRNSALHPVPSEAQVTLSIRRGTTNLIEQAKLEWTKAGAAIDEDEASGSMLSIASAKFSNRLLPIWDLRNTELALSFDPKVDNRYSCNAESRVKVPEGAEWVMKKPIAAYTYPTPKGKIGYVRIPDYYPTTEAGEISAATIKAWFEKLRFVMHTMEKSTVGLIIDQDHNCGGSVELVENVVTLFSSKPEKPMQFQFRASKAAYLKNKAELATVAENTLEHESYKRFLKLLEDTLKSSRGSMTQISAVTGRDIVYPDNEARYTKPVVILIDEIAGSGGDAFPAIMKGIGRAKLFGQQTSGLGGSVESFGSLNHSQMTIRMTVSQFFKPDGSPVENNGAVPDMLYTETRDDLMYSYQPRQKAYTDYLLQQLP